MAEIQINPFNTKLRSSLQEQQHHHQTTKTRIINLMCFRGNFHNVICVQTIRVVFSLSLPMLMYTFVGVAAGVVTIAHFVVSVHVPNKILSGIFFFYNCLLRLYP